ncbi:MAG: aminoacetone oxidase family FAD-binding enzyme, partial [Planctomycetaceae bacterium]|nr:aminoacetone oxidase family FAD-binding enzyme [Planctomycetaceae bacterium]
MIPGDQPPAAESTAPQRTDFDVCVVGGGAAGFMAAMEAAKHGASVVLLERNERAGKKILISGGGKCNITNIDVSLDRYHGTHPRFIQDALRSFDQSALRAWLAEIGVETVEGENYGKVWPVSMMSKTVVAALEQALTDAGGELHTGRDVVGVERTEKGFRLLTKQLVPYTCRALVMASGGRAAPHLGATDSGLKLMEKLGHKLVPQYPALAGLHLEGEWWKELQGITCDDVELTLDVGGKDVLTVRGMMLFTHYGINSPEVFRLSREVEPAIEAGKSVKVYVNFNPELLGSRDDAVEMVYHTLGANTKKQADIAVGEIVRYRRLGAALVKLVGGNPEHRVRELQQKQREKLEELIFRCPFSVTGTQGWERAEVMRGGVDVKGVDPKTMASKVCEGLFICGEMLDIDGDVGGFNFQFAFASGKAAGAAAAKRVTG